MNHTPIEDIIIDHSGASRKNKKGKVVLIILILLVCILFAVGGFYWYITHQTVTTSKELFSKSITNMQVNYFLNNDVYEEMFNKMKTSNLEADSSLTFSTTMENEDQTMDVDLSKFVLDWTSINHVEPAENYNELKLIYSDNEIFKVKSINNENQFALVSDEIVNKYVGVHKDNSERVKQVLGMPTIDIAVDLLKNGNNKTDLDENEKNQKIKEYFDFMMTNIPEEKFTSQDNYVLEKDVSGNTSVTAYNLTLTQEEWNQFITEVLTKLKEDTTLIDKIVTGEVTETENDGSSFQINSSTNFDPVGTEENVTIPEEENIPEEEFDSEENLEEENPLEDEEPLTNQEQEDVFDTETENREITENTLDLKDLVTSILLNQKIEGTAEEFKDAIDAYIDNLSAEGNGLNVSVYVSENATEKLTLQLPDYSTIDIEFDGLDKDEKTIILTYLERENIEYDENNAVVYSAADNAVSEEMTSVTDEPTNGFKLELHKTQKEAGTSIKATYNFIKNKEINQKIIINLKTEGSTGSKEFNNDFVCTYSNNDGEFKITVDNSMKFDTDTEVEPLTDENCLFLDTLNDEELQVTIDAIRQKIQEVYTTKLEDLDFIDTNTSTSATITQNTIEEDAAARDAIRELLVSTISNQMGEAQSRGEEYTIQNLEGLQIADHEVTVSIENDVASVTVDNFKFRIDVNFNLSDVK